jgi:hypothetical protein
MIAAYAWLSGGEIPSQRLRSYTFGVASAVAFAGAWLATFTAPYFINPDALNWGPEYGMSIIPSNSRIRSIVKLTLHRLDLGTFLLPHRGMGLLLPARDQESHARGDR